MNRCRSCGEAPCGCRNKEGAYLALAAVGLLAAVGALRKRGSLARSDEPFITDMQRTLPVRNQKGKVMGQIQRYAVWTNLGRGKPEVAELSDDLKYLKKKWGVPNSRVVKLPGPRGGRNVGAAEDLAIYYDTGGTRQAFRQHYPQSARNELEVYRGEELFHGRNVAWAGDKGKMLPVSDYAYPIEGNIFDSDKFSSIVSQVQGRRASGQSALRLRPGYALLGLVDRLSIEESIQYGDEQAYGRTYTTGDTDLDEYLEDPDAYSGSEKKEFERELKAAEKRGDGDFGELSVQVRDGNHRTFGALAGGEPYVFVTIADNQVDSLLNDRTPRNNKIYKAVRAIQKQYGAPLLTRPRRKKVKAQTRTQLDSMEARYESLKSDERKLQIALLNKYDQYNKSYSHRSMSQRMERPGTFLNLLMKDVRRALGVEKTYELTEGDDYFQALKATEEERRKIFDKLWDLRVEAGLDPRTGEPKRAQ